MLHVELRPAWLRSSPVTRNRISKWTSGEIAAVFTVSRSLARRARRRYDEDIFMFTKCLQHGGTGLELVWPQDRWKPRLAFDVKIC
jgi:hypothetical protein